MKVKCWSKMKKAWTRLSRKIGLRRSSGHVKLQQAVRTCDYEDVHVLWEMLKREESNPRRRKKNSFPESIAG